MTAPSRSCMRGRKTPRVAPWRAAASAAVLVVLAGCAGTPRENLYTLTAVAPAGSAASPAPATTANAPGDAAIAVETASVPELVDRPQLVIRAGDNRVVMLEQQRWAEPLGTQISRVVAVDLARLLGSARVSAAPAARASAAYRITLDVQVFESRPGEAVAIEALWSIRGPAGTTPKNGRTAVREAAQGDGYEPLASAHSRALAALSRDIAVALQALVPAIR